MYIRRSIHDLEDDYKKGNKAPLETLIRAWKGIQELPSDNPNSFFMIAGFHGEPFRGAGWGNPQWWGGYCMHGNVLFPVWHRAYLLRLEDALRSIKGCEQVALPYWDETGERTAANGIPEIFLSPTFPLDGVNVKNPLYSYVFQAGVYDNLPPQPDQPVEDYSKPPGYETVRYPFSGLVGATDVKATDVHNATLKALGPTVTNGYLNSNVKNWLNTSITINTGDVMYTGTRQKFAKCLEAPNYTIFSNTTSSAQWNEDHFGVQSWAAADAPNAAPEAVVPLESPHNDMHLAVGGCEVPTFDTDNIEGANGDMGENDTAGFDPIFYFHHCFVDKTFWDWQQKWGSTKALDIISGYPGTNSVDSQGPTPGIPGNVWLTMETPLAPFKKRDGTTMIGKDLIDIENQLGYSYPKLLKAPLVSPLPKGCPVLRVSGVDRGAIAGSFVVSTWASNPSNPSGKKSLVGMEAVLSRWHVQGCSNCQNHLPVKAHLPLYGWSHEDAQKAEFEVRVHTHADKSGKKFLGSHKGTKPTVQLGRMQKKN